MAEQDYPQDRRSNDEKLVRGSIETKPGLVNAVVHALREYAALDFNREQLETLVNVPYFALETPSELSKKARSLAKSVFSSKSARETLSDEQLEGILNLVYESPKPNGASNKVEAFLYAILETQDRDFLSTLPFNFERYTAFVDYAIEVEEFRKEINDSGMGLSYVEAFDIMNKLGKERFQGLVETLGTNFRSKLTILDLIDESEKLGYSPETLLNLRIGEVSESLFGDNSDEEE